MVSIPTPGGPELLGLKDQLSDLSNLALGLVPSFVYMYDRGWAINECAKFSGCAGYTVCDFYWPESKMAEGLICKEVEMQGAS